MKRRDEPCKCGWKYVGYHVCVDLTRKCPGEGDIFPAGTPKKDRRKAENRSQEHRDNHASAMELYWAKEREKHKDRDQEIVNLYRAGDVGTRAIAKRYGIAYQTVLGILQRAADEGDVIIRPRGRTIAKEKALA